jgi:glycosyltransferase involved in cell wall biosynthesis
MAMRTQLKVALGIPWYFPNSIGGMEMYVATLSAELQKHNISCVVVVPETDGKAATSSHRNVRVEHINAEKFGEWLTAERPNVYHQHDWSLDCGLSRLRAAKELGIRTITTLHLAKVVCRRGTMMYEGKSQCDGRIVEQRCAQCFLTSRGIPPRIADAVSRIPIRMSAGLTNLPGIGPLFSGQVGAKVLLQSLKSVAETVDRIVTVSEWLKEALLINGIAASKVLWIRSGVDPEVASTATPATTTADDALRIGFLGRANPAKGLHLLIASLLRLPSNIEFSLQGLLVSDGPASNNYLQEIRKQIGGQSRFRLMIDRPRSDVHEFFDNVDVLAIPSQLVETGPLVALEANAWKVPVVGSNLGGLREIVRHQIDGLLLAHDDIDAWTDAFRKLAQDPALLRRLKGNIPDVRSMQETAREMMDLYRQLTENARSRLPPLLNDK